MHGLQTIRRLNEQAVPRGIPQQPKVVVDLARPNTDQTVKVLIEQPKAST